MDFIKDLEKTGKKSFKKEEIIEMLSQYNFIDAPKRWPLTKIVDELKKALIDKTCYLTMEKEEYVDDSTNDKWSIIRIYDKAVTNDEAGLTVITLCAVNSLSYKIRYLYECEATKKLFPLWILETIIYDDIKDKGI